MSAYEGYDAVSAWIYVESKNGETLMTRFYADDPEMTRTITTNKWVQVTLPMDKFMAKGDGSLNFSSIQYTASINSICIGEMKAINYEDLPETLVYDPAMGNLQQVGLIEHTAGVYGTVLKQFVTEIENTDTTYGGAYYRIAPNTNSDSKYGYIDVAPIHGTTAYAGYTHVKVWFYLETSANVATQTTICGLAVDANSNQWVSIDLPIETFVSGHFINVKWTNANNYNITGVRLGEIVAFKKIRTDAIFFEPNAEIMYTQLDATGAAYGWNHDAARSFSISTATTYGGSYVQIDGKNLTNKNQTGNIYITPNNAMSAYAEYTTIKAWIYLKALNNTNMKLYVFGAVYKEQIPTNQWVQLEIPVNATLLGNTNIWLQTQLANAGTWGITGIRIGEITAVK